MSYQYIQADSILNIITRKDGLFDGSYTVDPYQYCAFNCSYCDSGQTPTILIKSNAEALLRQKIKEIPKKRIIIGSVHDPYQPIEQKTRLTRDILLVLKETDHPIHIITKSDLILRDMDILQTMSDVYVSFSIISLDHMIHQIFEQDAPSPLKRLQTMDQLALKQIKTGVAMIPIFPFITDEMIEPLIIQAVKRHGRYFLHGFLELKGDQRQTVMEIIHVRFPALVNHYEELYDHSMTPNKNYKEKINKKIEILCKDYHIPYSLHLLKNKKNH